MGITEHDLQLFAARVRPHFEPELQDTAEQLALAIARHAGGSAKLLRPETTLAQILGWITSREENVEDSLDDVEAVMALEEGFGMTFPDELLSRPARTTYLELVRYAASRRART